MGVNYLSELLDTCEDLEDFDPSFIKEARIQLDEMYERLTILALLEQHGVDNWEGFDLAMEKYWKDKDEEW